MSKHLGGEEYDLRIVARPGDAPAIIRLRHVLKALLRTYNFRATSVRDITPYPDGPPVEAGIDREGKEQPQCLQP
jgi:hypothetical protein